MGTESNVDVARRAAIHAALADPARLTIVDTLVLGDASPSELASALGMASNLLAHHLRVLETVGLITRSRSEGDRRRTYLRLVPAALDRLAPSGRRAVPRVVFVCTANSARSQLASALWRRASRIPSTSAGTRPAERIDPGALAAARRHGLPLRRTRPCSLDDVVTDADLVVTVCDSAHEQLLRSSDLHWSLPDPVPAGTAAAFDQVMAELSRRIGDLAPRVTAS